MKKGIQRDRLTGSFLMVAICLSALLFLFGCDDIADFYGCDDIDDQSGCEELAVTTDQIPEDVRDWWTYEREATYRVYKSQIKVPMSDGADLGCTLSRPANALGLPEWGKFPGLVVEFTPYALMKSFFNQEAAFFTRRGYNTLVCTMRGVGQSDGEWDHAMGPQERKDAYELVKWLATQRFSDGNVGMFGESYGGYTTYSAAIEAAKDGNKYLKAVAPLQSPGSLYHDVIYPGGIKSTEGGTIDNWPEVAGMMSYGVIDKTVEYAVAHGEGRENYNEFWKKGALIEGVQDINIPVLSVGGWNDIFFRSGTLSMIEGNPENTWAIYVPFTHIYPVSAAEEPMMAQLPSGVLLAWFDKYLKGMEAETSVPDTPTFVSYQGPFGTNIDLGGGYEMLEGWPYADVLNANEFTYQLSADGRLVAADAADGTVTFEEPMPAMNLNELNELRNKADYCATFSTTLTQDRVLLGHSTLKLRATLSASDANLYAELIDVDGDGNETVVNDGFLKASHKDGHEPGDVAAITPGEEVDYTIPIRADHYLFRAGHTLMLRISGAPTNVLVPTTEKINVTISAGAGSTLSLSGFAR